MTTPIDHIPDAVFASNNEYEIPTLDLRMQAEYMESPFKIWGNQTRAQKVAGTWAFYCNDYKFTALWKHPDTILKTFPYIIVEPNFSTSQDMPNAVAIYGIFRKRWLARFWQMQGVRMIVDLCVAEKFTDLNLQGVPNGWGAYATRVTKGFHHLIDVQYEAAYQKCGGTPKLFIVYGGSKDWQARCQERGWLWIPEHMEQYKRVAMKSY